MVTEQVEPLYRLHLRPRQVTVGVVPHRLTEDGQIDPGLHHPEPVQRGRAIEGRGARPESSPAQHCPREAPLPCLWSPGGGSWLLDLAADALNDNPALEGIAPYVADSGEGRWTVAEAIELEVSAPVITLSLMERLRSREKDSFADKMLAALRDRFGGHGVKRG